MDSAVCAARTMVSTPDPAPTGRITRSGAPDCAQAGAEANRHEAATVVRVRRLNVLRMVWVMVVSCF